MMRGRRIAFDYGEVRIGVAVSDPDGILATPLASLLSQNPKILLDLAGLFDEYQPISVFIGEPKHMSGSSGDSVEKAKKFGELIEREFSLPPTFIDERLSTVSAARKLKEAGVNSRDSKLLIDSMAAVAILEQGLAIEKHS